MIQGKQNVIDWFKMQGKPYFSIFRKGEAQSTNVIFTNKDREDDAESAAAYLTQCLALLKTGDFFIYCHKENTPTSKGRSETFFTIPINETTAPAATPAVSGHNYSMEEIEAKAATIAETKFQQLMDKRELADTKKKLEEQTKEIKALKDKADAPMTAFLGSLAPYMPNIIAGIFPQQPGIGNIPQPDSKINEATQPAAELTDDDQEKAGSIIQAFCTALATRYPAQENPAPGYMDWLQIIEKLTGVIKNSPNKIDVALTML